MTIYRGIMDNALNTRTPNTSFASEDTAAFESDNICPHCNSSMTLGQCLITRRLAGSMQTIMSCVYRYIYKLFHPGSHHNKAKDAPRINQLPMGSFGGFSFEDMAQITLDAIGDAVLVVDPKLKVIYLNKVAETLTGWSRKKALGRPANEVFYILDGTTRQRAKSPAQQAISEGRIVELALGSVLIRRDGTDIAIEDSAAPSTIAAE